MEPAVTTGDALSVASLENLKSVLEGELLLPGEEAYERARMGWNLSSQQHPEMVLIARTASDISQAVRFAVQAGLGVGVQSTGHGMVLPADGGLLILTSELKGVRINNGSHFARIAAGEKWGTVLDVAQEQGLAPLLGSSPTVGVVGYTLGGGLGWLARKYGLATDSVIAIELVTADGQKLRASADENSDLFWALRGGGGGFGVVTTIEIELFPVAQVFGGTLMYPVELAEEVFKSYRAWAMGLPEEWTTSVKVANFPPVEFLPETLRGKSFVMVNGCYCGDPAEGEAYIKDWLDWGAHIQNSFRVMPFTEVASISQEPQDPIPFTHSGAWLNEFNDEAIETIIQFATPLSAPTPLTITEVRHVGGAMSRIDGGENAFGLRSCPLVLDIIAFTPTPERAAVVKEHRGRFKAAMAPHLADRVYMNFLDGDEARQNSRHAFSAGQYQRLKHIKAKYDPQNIFRFGFDIQPES